MNDKSNVSGDAERELLKEAVEALAWNEMMDDECLALRDKIAAYLKKSSIVVRRVICRRPKVDFLT